MEHSLEHTLLPSNVLLAKDVWPDKPIVWNDLELALLSKVLVSCILLHLVVISRCSIDLASEVLDAPSCLSSLESREECIS